MNVTRRQEQPRTFSSNRPIRRALVVGAAALALTACPTGVDWSDYEGVNLIANRQFGATDTSGTSLWYFADGLQTATGAPVDYVVFEEVAAGVYGTLPPGVSGPVYRYEVVNLFRDGTFEEETVADPLANPSPVAGWISNDSDLDGSLTRAAIINAGTNIESQSLRLDFQDGTPYFAIDLDVALLDAPVATTDQYAYHFDFRMGIQTLAVELHNNTPGGGSWSVQTSRLVSRGDPISEVNDYAFPGSFGANPDLVDSAPDGSNLLEPESGLPFFSFGGFDADSQKTSIVATIDNIRFVRADQNHHVRLPVPYSESGRPDLLSGGSYTITLWARNDPTALQAGSENRNVARFLSAGIDPRINDPFAISKTRAVSGTARHYTGDLTGWEQFTFVVSGSEISISPNTPGSTVVFDLVLEIGDSISGPRFKDSGSILISGISVSWSPAAP